MSTIEDMKDLTKAFESGMSSAENIIITEINRRIFNRKLPKHLEDSQYWKGYRDALGELLEWIEEPKE